jgi:hypothetical protein
MDRKEATMIAIIATALLATIMTTTSSTSAFALGHWNLDEDFVPTTGMRNSDAEHTNDEEKTSDEDSKIATANDEELGNSDENSGDTDNPDGNVDPSQVAYEDLQACLSDSSGEGSPSEQEVQDCINSSYGGEVSAENAPTDSADEVDEDEDGVTEEVSTDDSDDDEENGDNEE